MIDVTTPPSTWMPNDTCVSASAASTVAPHEMKSRRTTGETNRSASAENRSAPRDEAQGPAVLYRTFDDLYKYCYHVASVVGLVCIRIFGYRDPAAEPLAERTGLAFQLTNIIYLASVNRWRNNLDNNYNNRCSIYRKNVDGIFVGIYTDFIDRHSRRV